MKEGKDLDDYETPHMKVIMNGIVCLNQGQLNAARHNIPEMSVKTRSGSCRFMIWIRKWVVFGTVAQLRF